MNCENKFTERCRKRELYDASMSNVFDNVYVHNLQKTQGNITYHHKHLENMANHISHSLHHLIQHETFGHLQPEEHKHHHKKVQDVLSQYPIDRNKAKNSQQEKSL